MTSKAGRTSANTSARKRAQDSWHSWNRLSLFAVLAVIVGVVGGIIWGASTEADETDTGERLQPFALPDAISGETVSIDDEIGRKEMVIVTLMGGFCRGCFELAVELENRAAEFGQAGVDLLIISSETEEEAGRTASEAGVRSVPFLYEKDGPVVRQLGMWSDHMYMAWMGYMIIDGTGKIVTREQQLSEAAGAGPRNVDAILAALEASRGDSASS